MYLVRMFNDVHGKTGTKGSTVLYPVYQVRQDKSSFLRGLTVEGLTYLRYLGVVMGVGSTPTGLN